jgi:4-oxalocrotonate tautomerase
VNPLVGIDLTRNSSPELRRTISEVVYSAMTEIANVPAHDKFQIFTLFEPDELVFSPEGHLDIDCTQDIIFIQVYWASSSTIDTKTAFFRKNL